MGYIPFLLPKEISAEDAQKLQAAAAAANQVAGPDYQFVPEEDYSTMQWGNATGNGFWKSWKPWQKGLAMVGVAAIIYGAYRWSKGKKVVPTVTVK